MSSKNTSLKSKLFKLKEWLTISETAKHLSIMFGEEVTDADVLRLGLDRHLKLSVNFVNYAHAKRGGKFLPFEEWEIKFKEIATWQNANFMATKNGTIALYFLSYGLVWSLKDDELVKENRSRHFGPDDKLKSSYLNKLTIEEQNKALTNIIEGGIATTLKQSEKFQGRVPPSIHSFKGNVITIEGVWDLPMLGNECNDIEHEFQMLTGGPEVTLLGFDGAFVEREDGVIFQIQERFPTKDSIQNSYKLNDIEKEIVDAGTITKERLLEIKKERANRPFNHPDNYYPAGGLPRDSVLVVRTRELRAFLNKLSSEDSEGETPQDISILDSNHRFHAKELKIAIEAWKELYEKNPPQHVPLGGHKRYITKWLEKNHPELGQRAKDNQRKPKFLNLHCLEIPYGTLEKVYKVSRPRIPGAIDELLAKGFIKISYHGGACKHDKSKFSWSDNYLFWTEHTAPFEVRPKRERRGYQGRRLGATAIKKKL